ncbi:autotransporter-associated beta strand repeat-containing protein [Prosthecobacter sp. SYSU 5D2]|uniref:autotransporter-associated beta strand repeat-containing protein n=1 Tax=Prosthecobacter sp. SYSU 5D2 TaxID=3134134 RepID=UPI0031FF3552
MKRLFWPLLAVLVCTLRTLSAQTASPTFGNITVLQNNETNAANGVSLSLSYSQAALSADGITSLGNIALRSGSNRGDFLFGFTPTTANDRSLGIMISNVAQLTRDNTAFGDATGPLRATSATANDANGYFIPVHSTPAGGEFNINLAASWFPYADGWIGGHAVNSANGGILTSMASSPGLTLSTTAPGPSTLYDPGATGVYELNLAGINSQTDGILIVTGGKNEDNYAGSIANADGTWTIQVKDNGANGAATEPDGLAFVYVPTTSVVSGDAPGVHAMGRLNGNLSRDITGGNYAFVRSATGRYELYAPGIDPAQATLLLSPELADVAGDNLWFYEPTTHGWDLEYLDLPGLGYQDNGNTADSLSFVLMASGSTAAIWDAGGANTGWTTAGNWTGDVLPTAGQDVVIGTGTGNVAINSGTEVGMLMISRPTGFTLSSNTPLPISTGIIINSRPTSTQTFIISAPLVLEEDAFIFAQTIGSSLTLRLDVASGNAVTAEDKNLMLGGGSGIEIRDPISLGSGKLIKEGANQVTLTTAHNVGGVQIFFGPTSTTNGAFRLNAPAAYGGFGNGDIVLTHPSGNLTALYFDSAAGSGTFANNLVLQSAATNAGARILVDSAAGFNTTMSGLISGGNATSEFIVSNDAAGGQGRLHLTNESNSFTALRVNLNRGGLVIYSDGALGDATNPLYLDTNNTTPDTLTGLHFGADNITLAATRAVTLNTPTAIQTGAFHSTIAGDISGMGGLAKTGTGTLTLTGSNSYAGSTLVQGGTLLLNPATGSAIGLGPVSIDSTATLAGQGDVAGAVSVLAGGRITPGIGTQAGTLSLLTGLDVQGDGRLVLDLFANGQNDRLAITGTLQMSTTSMIEVLLQYTPSAGDQFDLLDWSTLIVPGLLEDRLSVPDLTSLGLAWDYTQFQSQGILGVQFIPEPTRGILLLTGMMSLLFRRRR